MPIVNSSYQTSRSWFKNAHINTITPALLRKVEGVNYQREVLELDDGDFLDLDWFLPSPSSDQLLIACHGLEGGADRPYIRGVCKLFGANGWHALAINQRTCGGKMNRLPRAYNMGVTDDLHRCILLGVQKGYRKIALVGYSMGGNQILKYLGEYGAKIPKQVVAGVAFSVPCHIPSANIRIGKWYNWLYVKRFMTSLNQKMKLKYEAWPDIVNSPYPLPKNLLQFDERFTGPIHGYSGAEDYYKKCSSRQFIPNIDRPCLLVNAQDDTFLSTACYPIEEANNMPNFFLEMPKYGGHVGFAGTLKDGEYWSDQRAFEFVDQYVAKHQ